MNSDHFALLSEATPHDDSIHRVSDKAAHHDGNMSFKVHGYTHRMEILAPRGVCSKLTCSKSGEQRRCRGDPIMNRPLYLHT
jgi:hypothetical protein